MIPTIQFNGAVDNIVILGQPKSPEITDDTGTINQDNLDTLDIDCKAKGSLYYDVTTNRCEAIPTDAEPTYKDKLIFTTQSTAISKDNALAGSVFTDTDTITIPNPVLIRGYLVIQDTNGNVIEDNFRYNVFVTCEGLITFCNLGSDSEWHRRGSTHTNGYYEQIFRPSIGERPGEYMATIIGISENRNEDGSRAEVHGEYRFRLVE